MAGPGIARYYDRLTRWNSVARLAGYGGGLSTLTVHRALADPAAEGRPTTTRLHDLLCEHLAPLPAPPRVLDAGCGCGGTMIDLARRLGGTYIGVTLSAHQAALALRGVERAGLQASVDVQVRSYDEPPAGPFDVILAIESLAHSPSPGHSLAALAGVLAPGGRLVLVDDMPEPGGGSTADLEIFKHGWHCPALWGRSQYLGAFAVLGFDVMVDRDLTADTRPRTVSGTGRLDWWNRFARRALPFGAFRAVMDSHRGGLALERLARSGWMRYRMVVGRKM